MNFKQAIEEMKKGKKVRRKGWKDVWLTLDNGGSVLRTIPNMYKGTIKGTITGFELLTLENAENVCADDWEVVEEKKWGPKKGAVYWYINPDGGIDYYSYENDETDKNFIAIGNCFQTEKQAEFMVEKLKVIHELEKFAYENNSEEIDWNNENQEKYIITFNHITQDCGINLWRVSRSNPFNVYFTSEEIARKAIETIGEERIKRYYFGVGEDE